MQCLCRSGTANLCYSRLLLQSFRTQCQVGEGHIWPGGSPPSNTHVSQVTLSNGHLLTHLVEELQKSIEYLKVLQGGQPPSAVL